MQGLWDHAAGDLPSRATALLNVSSLFVIRLRRTTSTGASAVTPAAPDRALARKWRAPLPTSGRLSEARAETGGRESSAGAAGKPALAPPMRMANKDALMVGARRGWHSTPLQTPHNFLLDRGDLCNLDRIGTAG